MIKTASVIGARPQFVKYSPLARAIEQHNLSHREKVANILIHSGQHYDFKMSEIFFRELGIAEPEYHLNAGSASHAVQTAMILERCERVFLTEKPDLVLVFGDINTALGAALAAAKLHIPVAHVEAGLRSYNRKMPEEINRVLIDHMSMLLFCPSYTAVANLQKEGFHHLLDEGRLVSEGFSQKLTLDSGRYESMVVHCGDLMYDALLFSATLAESKSTVMEKLALHDRDYFLLTMHRSENTCDLSKMAKIIDFINRVTVGKKVIFPIHPRTEKVFHEAKVTLAKHIQTIEPLGYFDMLKLLKHSEMLFTDSGGMQKEAFWLNTPCVTLREETEWLETVQSGGNVLYRDYGSQREPQIRDRQVYGSGRAAQAIVNILANTGII